MKISRVLLRWYKSFNVSYQDAGPDRLTSEKHPWNSIDVGPAGATDYPFIEIPIEQDITTIVGSNESGKSHLLDAISKVISGRGLHYSAFSQTDFCRYATVPNQNTDRWPNIGLEFTAETQLDIDAVLDAIGQKHLTAELPCSVALIVGTRNPDVAAHLYIALNEQPYTLGSEELESIRAVLPRVKFLNAESALPDNLTLEELLRAAGLDDEGGRSLRVNARLAQQSAEILAGLDFGTNGEVSAGERTKIENLKSALMAGTVDVTEDAMLAATLFTEVLDVKPEVLKSVLDQPSSQRGFTQYYLDTWNDQIIEKLDLAHFWQQDDQASLELVYKDTTLYFDITDKTGATYTFQERSSGLRYFLSYYIQAKALQLVGQKENAVILMDEPDSFLSILGQRNMLSVFESLVSFQSSSSTSQLLYTTHSPFLINRNFPRRIRVVVKEEAEEGTQYHGKGSSRRYEPVRSALGIDCAQTLFMGATNLVLEGLTDQYLLNELIRIQITPENVHDMLDLNAIVVVSADGVNNIEKLLVSSQWGDEPIPATVVMVDGDDQGRSLAKRISGQERGAKKLIDEQFAIILDAELHAEFKDIDFVTIEDLIPWDLYSRAFCHYMERWHPDVWEKHAVGLPSKLESSAAVGGNVNRLKAVCMVTDGCDHDLDKLGILQHVITIVSDGLPSSTSNADVDSLIARSRALFQVLNEKIYASVQLAATRSMSTNVKRVIREFLRTRTNGSSVIDLRRHLQRIVREAKTVPDIGETLRERAEWLDARAYKLETGGLGQISGSAWEDWTRALNVVKQNPITPADFDFKHD